MISFINLPTEIDMSEEELQKWLTAVAQDSGARIKRLSYSYMDNKTLLEINKEHLNHDYFTDIISFNYGNTKAIEGEIYISSEQVILQAADYETTVKNEFLRVTVHGLLHFLGWDDKNAEDQLEMTNEEEKSLVLQAQMFEN